MRAGLAAVALALAFAPLGGATDGGGLDPAWGSGGKVDTRLGGIDDAAQAVAVQPDGKVVVAGTRRSSGLPDRFGRTGSNDWFLVRYLPTGAVDAAFGTGGVAALDLSGADDRAFDLVLEPDGKIVVVGSARAGTAGAAAAVARLRPDGQRDLGFGDNGVAFLDLGDDDAAFAVARAEDGAFVVAGRTGRSGVEETLVYRLSPNGEPVAAFGKVVLDTSPEVERAVDIAIAADGKIVTLVQRLRDSAVYRLNRDGTLDRSWAGDGSAEIEGGAEALALVPDGNVLVAGAAGVVRLTASGTPDSSFGAGGAGVAARDIALLPDGRIVVGGTAGAAPSRDFAIGRLEPNGRRDASFGGDGIATTDFLGDDVANAVAAQPDGKVVLAGGTTSGGNTALARYLPGNCAVPRLVARREAAARAALVAAECRVGTVRRAFSPRPRGLVVSQSRPPRAVLDDRARVDFVVSRGPKQKKRR